MDLTKEKIRHGIAERKRTHAEFLDKAKTYRSFLDIEKAAFAPGALETKQKELMALCVSIVTEGPSPASRDHSDRGHFLRGKEFITARSGATGKMHDDIPGGNVPALRVACDGRPRRCVACPMLRHRAAPRASRIDSPQAIRMTA